jgi:hypothetical protein
VWTYEELKNPVKQERVIRTIIDTNYAQLLRQLDERGLRVTDVVGRRRRCRPFPELPPIQIECTLSGLLAAAHLCGTAAVVEFVESGALTGDEFATPLWKYLIEFSNFDMPYDDVQRCREALPSNQI